MLLACVVTEHKRHRLMSMAFFAAAGRGILAAQPEENLTAGRDIRTATLLATYCCGLSPLHCSI